MLFKKGVDVFSSDNEKIGTLDRVVMDPKTKEVTHIIVREGFLFTEDKVVPMDLIGSVTDERISLQGSKEHLDELPEYEETHYIPRDATVDDDMSTLYWILQYMQGVDTVDTANIPSSILNLYTYAGRKKISLKGWWHWLKVQRCSLKTVNTLAILKP